MITRCDHCGSKFEVSEEVVYSDDPGVRCGECMSLFDSRANLYNAADVPREAAYKPVQTGVPLRSSVETADLETADTIASEHLYASEHVFHSSARHVSAHVSDHHSDHHSGKGIEVSGRMEAVHGSLADGLDTGGHRNHPEHRVDDYPRELEFGRTLATESALTGSMADNMARNTDFETTRDGVGLPQRPDHSGVENRSLSGSADALTAEELTQRKRQMMREREHRALGMEPARDFESLPVEDEVARELAGRSGADRSAGGMDPQQRRQVDEFRSRNREIIRSRGDDRDVVRDGAFADRRPTYRDEHEFIPDDVLRESKVYRDNGRRPDDLQFGRDTPQFGKSPGVAPEPRSRQRSRDQRPVDADTDRQPPKRQAENDRSADLHGSELKHLHDEAHDDASYAIYEQRPVVSGTSAQEMRRYQRHRPAMDVRKEDDLVAERAPTKRRRGLGFSSLLWAVGLLLAVGLLVFAARNIIANMNLPEPVISGFCQITGCVPADAKKEVAQLQTMRKRLYPHPEIEDALVISVDVVNNSIYKQPYPTLAVTLLDTTGESVAERDFEAADYEVVDGSDTGFLMPGEPTRMKIEVVDTGLGATEVDLVFK